LIISGELRPGEKIKAEHVAETLQVSPTPVREALQALRTEGFVTLVPRHGFAVAPLSSDDVRDLFKVQALLAGEMAARAAQRATAEAIAEMLRIHLELTQAADAGDAERLEHLNHAFHRHINLTADSRKLLWAIGLMSRYVPRQFYGSITGWPETTIHDHQQLVDAIRSGDADLARSSMESHITTAGELLATYLGRRLAESAESKETA
jgi:DNA-binding GntR family transcriptional regulator